MERVFKHIYSPCSEEHDSKKKKHTHINVHKYTLLMYFSFPISIEVHTLDYSKVGIHSKFIGLFAHLFEINDRIQAFIVLFYSLLKTLESSSIIRLCFFLNFQSLHLMITELQLQYGKLFSQSMWSVSFAIMLSSENLLIFFFLLQVST